MYPPHFCRFCVHNTYFKYTYECKTKKWFEVNFFIQNDALDGEAPNRTKPVSSFVDSLQNYDNSVKKMCSLNDRLNVTYSPSSPSFKCNGVTYSPSSPSLKCNGYIRVEILLLLKKRLKIRPMPGFELMTFAPNRRTENCLIDRINQQLR